jgi:hypothetical protein
MKKPWEKPELVVLVKARPEECVLDVCKYPQIPHSGPHEGHDGQLNCKYVEATGCPTCSQHKAT